MFGFIGNRRTWKNKEFGLMQSPTDLDNRFIDVPMVSNYIQEPYFTPSPVVVEPVATGKQEPLPPPIIETPPIAIIPATATVETPPVAIIPAATTAATADNTSKTPIQTLTGSFNDVKRQEISTPAAETAAAEESTIFGFPTSTVLIAGAAAAALYFMSQSSTKTKEV